MKILKITSQFRNDFSAIMTCEHCEHQQELFTGYDDAYYHAHVIPSMFCEWCSKDRKGEVMPQREEAFYEEST